MVHISYSLHICNQTLYVQNLIEFSAQIKIMKLIRSYIVKESAMRFHTMCNRGYVCLIHIYTVSPWLCCPWTSLGYTTTLQLNTYACNYKILSSSDYLQPLAIVNYTTTLTCVRSYVCSSPLVEFHAATNLIHQH